MKNQSWIYARESDAKNIENHQKLDPKGIQNPPTIHPKIDQKVNAKNVTKRTSKRGVAAQAPPPLRLRDNQPRPVLRAPYTANAVDFYQNLYGDAKHEAPPP